MSDSKRLDIQFGSFACSVQGFDDPVQPVQQVLQALQSLLEETPELADADISFDAEAIERLIGEVARRADIAEENVEIIPGLIIVHRSNADAAAAVSQAFDAVDKNGQPDTVDDTKPGYINIFSPGSSTDAETEGAGDERTDPFAAFAIDAEEPDVGGDTPRNDPFSARLAQAAVEETAQETAPPSATPFAAAAETLATNVFADPDPADADSDPMTADTDAMTDLFAAAGDADKNSGNDADAMSNMFASTEPDAEEPAILLKSPDYATPGITDEDSHRGQEYAPENENSERVAALFGASGDQPDVEETDEGYTAAGLAKTAEAKTVSELMVSAAAWMVLIQGQTTFTRKEVVKVFKTIPGEHKKTLEAQIKGFGKAVRGNQLVMIEEGVFGLSRTEVERFQLLL